MQVDEGQCSSQSGCGSNTSCQAVNFDLKAILSPKGVCNTSILDSVWYSLGWDETSLTWAEFFYCRGVLISEVEMHVGAVI